MTKKKTKTNSHKSTQSLKVSKKSWVVVGSFLLFFGVSLIFAFISYLFTWQEDQSSLNANNLDTEQAQNWLSRFGATISDFFIYDGFGIAAFIFAFLVTLTGIYFFFNIKKKPLLDYWFWGIYNSIWLSIALGFFLSDHFLLAGKVGYMTNEFLDRYIGQIGIGLLLALMFIIYLVIRHNLAPEALLEKMGKTSIRPKMTTAEEKDGIFSSTDNDTANEKTDDNQDKNQQNDNSTEIELTHSNSGSSELQVEQNMVKKNKKQNKDEPEFSVENNTEEPVAESEQSDEVKWKLKKLKSRKMK